MCAVCAASIDCNARKVVDEGYLNAYWLQGMLADADSAEIFFCNSCYCAVTNATSVKVTSPHRGTNLSPQERIKVFSVEHFFLQEWSAFTTSVVARVLEMLDAELDEASDSTLRSLLRECIAAAHSGDGVSVTAAQKSFLGKVRSPSWAKLTVVRSGASARTRSVCSCSPSTVARSSSSVS